MKPATSNLASSWSLPRPIINPLEKCGCRSGLGELPEIWGFPFNISATAEAIDFKLGTQLGFAQAHYKITPRGNSAYGLGLGELPNNLRFNFNIYTIAEVRDFKFGTQRKSGRGLGLGELPYIWGTL